MQVELNPDEINSLVEALDCLKTKISFTKGASYAEKTEKLLKADALEQKLRAAHAPTSKPQRRGSREPEA